MQQSETLSKCRRGKLRITQESVVGIILYAIETDGLEAARSFFEQMNKYCSTERGWPETAREIRDIFAERRKLQAAPGGGNVFFINDITAQKTTAIGSVDQMNGVVENGAQVIHSKFGG